MWVLLLLWKDEEVVAWTRAWALTLGGTFWWSGDSRQPWKVGAESSAQRRTSLTNVGMSVNGDGFMREDNKQINCPCARQLRPLMSERRNCSCVVQLTRNRNEGFCYCGHHTQPTRCSNHLCYFVCWVICLSPLFKVQHLLPNSLYWSYLVSLWPWSRQHDSQRFHPPFLNSSAH